MGFGVIAARGLFTGRKATFVALQLGLVVFVLIFAGLGGFVDSSSGLFKSSGSAFAMGVELSVTVPPTSSSASGRGGDIFSAIGQFNQ